MKNMILVGQMPAQRIYERTSRRFRFQAFGAFLPEGLPKMGCAVTEYATS